MTGKRMRDGYLEIPARPDAVRHARVHVHTMLRKWNLGVLVETAELLVSELAANAVTATRGMNRATMPGARDYGTQHTADFLDYIWVDVHRTPGAVVLEVGDPSPDPPRLRPAALDDEGGRGLFLVSVLAAGWGHRLPVTGGKVVWCALACPAAGHTSDGL
ncbi:ATP-binding protein [Sphaerisporangium rufum]|uniref:ATP-binding protein n=1 Tax=Sphaerisporangium rufum TaxID=1381558 RepID=A0A919QYM4_9ACTN|nr:ATP-binding protein [Sphaerisporangium rufum]GII76474.1 ATP-binding protein [Sphaerisporangium rufum]